MKRTCSVLISILFGAFICLAQNAEKPCAAAVDIISNPEHFSKNEEGVITAKTDADLGKRVTRYEWKVTGGKIIEGQNTPSIKILRESNSLQVAVKLRVAPDNCVLETGFATFDDVFDSQIVDEYGEISETDEKASLDAFFEKLKKDPNTQGYIFVTDDRNMKRRLRFLIAYLDFKKIGRENINFLIGEDYGLRIGRPHNLKTALWIVPPGAEIPRCKDCIDIRANDSEKLKKIFQLKFKQ